MKKRKIRLLGARTFVVLEQTFWHTINVILQHKHIALHDSSQMAQERRRSNSLPASLRLVTLLYFQSMAEMQAMSAK